jgi:hypothetical protein
MAKEPRKKKEGKANMCTIRSNRFKEISKTWDSGKL